MARGLHSCWLGSWEGAEELTPRAPPNLHPRPPASLLSHPATGGKRGPAPVSSTPCSHGSRESSVGLSSLGPGVLSQPHPASPWASPPPRQVGPGSPPPRGAGRARVPVQMPLQLSGSPLAPAGPLSGLAPVQQPPWTRKPLCFLNLFPERFPILEPEPCLRTASTGWLCPE